MDNNVSRVAKIEIEQERRAFITRKQQATSELEIDIFDGNPMDFHYFMAVFEEVVENKVTDQKWWLNCLIKFTKGKTR